MHVLLARMHLGWRMTLSLAVVVWACMKKDIKSALSERIFTLVSVLIPANFMVLMSLFVLAGSNAPTAVVQREKGLHAQQFYDALSSAHSFRLQQADTQEAQRLLQAGRIVAIVTVPSNFDTQIEHNLPVQIDVEINNLNTDFTDDIRRALPLAITSFYAKAFPNVVTIVPHEHDLYAQDTDYIPYLGVSILVLSLTVGGILQAGMATAREWEKETMKELLLSPASRGAILLGKMLGALVMSLFSTGIVLAVLILVMGISPMHWGELVGTTLLSLTIFVTWGTLLGMLLKHRLPVTALAVGLAVPLFFVSGAFGPLSFNTPAIQVLAQLFPLYYAIVLQQHAFHDFTLNAYGTGLNALILVFFALGLLLLTRYALKRATVGR